jgi:hypothetical protein
MMVVGGWFIPLPSPPVKSDDDLRREREAKIAEVERRGLLGSERLTRRRPPCARPHGGDRTMSS